MSLYKTLNYAYLVNADKVRIPVLFPWASYLGKSCFVPPWQPKLTCKSSLETSSYKIRRADSLAKYAQPDLSVPAKASQQTQHTAQQYGAASITSCACDLLRHAKMVDILLPSLPTWSQGHNGL